MDQGACDEHLRSERQDRKIPNSGQTPISHQVITNATNIPGMDGILTIPG